MGASADLSTEARISIGQVDGHLAQAMLDDSPDCIKLLEPDGRLFYMSSNGMSAMDIDDFQMVENKIWWDLWPEKHRSTLIDAVEAANRGVSVSFEADCPTAKGNLRDWRVRVTKVSGGSHDGRLLAISEDITDRLRIRRVKNKLASENEALNRFSHLLVHDLRNPLRHISMISELLQRKLKNHEAEDFLKASDRLCNQIGAASRNLLHMIGGLQQLSATSTKSPEPTELESGLSLADFMAEAEQLIGDQRLVVQKTPEIDDYAILGNRGLLLSLFLNLFENSLKYSKEKTVKVRVNVTGTEEDLLIVNISDDGPGFPQGEQDKALVPLQRLSNSEGVEGTGMGLSLVDRIVRSHGGWVNVVSDENAPSESLGGACICLALPYVRSR